MATPLQIDRLCAELARDERLVLLLDLDGTLIPFAPTVEAAILARPVVETLQALRNAGVELVVASGRPRANVESLRPLLDGVVWFAEHGSWRCSDGSWCGPATSHELPELLGLLEPFTHVPGVRIEVKSQSICLHWRLVPAELKRDLITGCELTCDEWLDTHPDFERLDGVEMIELRRRSANKSIAVAWVREQRRGARIIAIGDDQTDEDMFAALREDELAIGVGRTRMHARHHLANPAAVHAFLAWMLEIRTTGACRPAPSLETRGAGARGRARLVVVSNRIPPPPRTDVDDRQRPVGGLVSALEPALRSDDGIWLGWSGGESDGARELTIHDDTKPVRASFRFPPEWRELFYGGFCNRALWPLFHGLPGRVHYADAEWLAYVAANQEFARHARDLVTPDGTVWIHDYHLLLAGRALRGAGFRGRLGLFLHIPFPGRELFDTLPWRDEIIASMLEHDLVGFHTEQWADNFRACARGVRPGCALPELAVLPIGVDPEAFTDSGEPLDREVAGLRTLQRDRKLILGVDRLDYSKGIPERLIAYERLLETTPEWHRKVAFVQVSVPSRAEVPEYAELRRRVENLVGRINGRFGEADWVPVRYLYRSYDHHVLAQLYRLADIALVTPLRDGLNLVAKEFVLAQDPANPGVLVLSRFAGAAEELRDAILTNPFHPDGIAADLDRALRMPLPERQRRQARLAAVLAHATPQRWAAAFLERLARSRAAA